MSTPFPSESFNLGNTERAGALERRAKPRIKEPFPARVWGVDTAGHPFSLDCLLDNMSARGLYLRMARRMEAGGDISLAVRLSNSQENGAIAGVRGMVLRNEPQPDGRHGIAVIIRHQEFL